MKKEVIAVFDIGKTNKKLLLFDRSLNLVSESEEKFPAVKDEDGFECDDVERIEAWIKKSANELSVSEDFDLTALNFATYGATLVYTDSKGRRLTPVYNYLKPVDKSIPGYLYERYGGIEEFSRKTASPSLGMLNSGIQALWLKKTRPGIFSKVSNILHFPQYLAGLVSGEVCSEHTSIGCHTAMWDFDTMKYHQWTRDENLPLPEPVSVFSSREVEIKGKKVVVGTGLHDSSSSLAPYFARGTGKFILISTGTWCISMNPFNSEKLTMEELSRDCLCYMSINGEPVKSSRLFLGHMHDEAVKNLSCYFKVHENSFRLVRPDTKLLDKLVKRFDGEKVFFENKNLMPVLISDPEFYVFDNFIEGYHMLMLELTDLAIDSMNLVIPVNDNIENIYISGGFSKNLLFTRLLASSFPDKKVYVSEISNATALGAAYVVLKALDPSDDLVPELGLDPVN